MNANLERIEDTPTLLQVEPMTATDSKTASAETPFLEPDVTTENKVRVEEFQLNGDSLMAKVKELIHQGNLRRLILKTAEGRTLLDIPFLAGVVGGVVGVTVFPIATAVAAVAALAVRLTIAIERKE